MTANTPAREGLPEREELKRDIACIMAGIDKAEHPLFLARAGALLDSLGARIAALASQPTPGGGEVGGPPFYAAIVETEADEYYDAEFPEDGHTSIHDVVVAAVGCGNANPGDCVEIGRAMTLPLIKVRVTTDGDDCGYELVSVKHDGQWHGINRTMPPHNSLAFKVASLSHNARESLGDKK